MGVFVPTGAWSTMKCYCVCFIFNFILFSIRGKTEKFEWRGAHRNQLHLLAFCRFGIHIDVDCRYARVRVGYAACEMFIVRCSTAFARKCLTKLCFVLLLAAKYPDPEPGHPCASLLLFSARSACHWPRFFFHFILVLLLLNC